MMAIKWLLPMAKSQAAGRSSSQSEAIIFSVAIDIVEINIIDITIVMTYDNA